MTRRLVAVLALVLASGLAFAAPPAGAQEAPPCDVESDPQCETPPDGGSEPGCDPDTDPECVDPGPGCDPELDPECVDPDPGCEPELDPECVDPDPGCDPELDPGCVDPDPGCDPELDPGCEGDPGSNEGGIPPPEHSMVDENCVYEYDQSGFGQCTNGDLLCTYTPFDDGSGLGTEACVLSEVLGPASPEIAQSGASTDTPRAATLPRTGSNLAPSVALAIAAIIAGTVCCVAGRRIVNAR